MTRTATLEVEVEFDDAVTDAESLATALDNLMDIALSTPQILDDYASPEQGPPQIGRFTVKSELAREVYDTIYRETESLHPHQTGAYTAYLLGAILSGHAIGLQPDVEENDGRFATLLREIFAAEHPVWTHIEVSP